MEIILRPELERFIKEKIANGQYQSLDEAINEGIKLLMDRDLIYKGRFEKLKEEIAIGVEASVRGEVINEEIVFEQLREKLEQRRQQSSNE
jgi:antitoxin ParD1/3/4